MTIGLKLLVGTALGVAVLTVMTVTLRSGHPLRHWLTSLIQGVCAIAAVDVAGIFTGVSLGFSWFSVACCAIFGIPGVISLLLMRLFTL